jgi:hypothetical protein
MQWISKNVPKWFRLLFIRYQQSVTTGMLTVMFSSVSPGTLIFRMIGFISTLVTSSLNHTSIQRYRQFTQFPITVEHALGFPVFTSRLLATDLKTETSTSNHYEVILLFRLQPFRNLGTKHSHTSSLRLTRDCPWTNSVKVKVKVKFKVILRLTISQ